MTRRLLVTGATGAIGHSLVRAFRRTRPLTLLVRASRAETARGRVARILGRADVPADVEVIEGDIALADFGLAAAERARLAGSLGGVLHLAARTDFRDDDVAAYRPVNVEGTRRAAELALEAGCPLLHVSTAYISGDREGRFGEDDFHLGQAFHNPYERSKWEAEGVVRALAAGRGLRATIVRPGIVLPDAPEPGIPPGPGPLVYLKHLANLEGTASRAARPIRIEGDPDARLNLVPEAFVVRVIAAALERPAPAPGAVETFHATAARPLRLAEVVEAANLCTRGIRLELHPRVEAPDRFEALLARSCGAYRPYHFLRTIHGRESLVGALGEATGRDGATPDWLRGVYARHLDAWRAERPARPVAPGAPAGMVASYFTRFLGERSGRRLVPGLESLTTDFTVTISSAGTFGVRVEDGRLVRAVRSDAPSPAFDYELDPAAFLEVASGRVRPAELFFRGKIRIRGDLFEALATATALSDFFRLHPYVPAPAAA